MKNSFFLVLLFIGYSLFSCKSEQPTNSFVIDIELVTNPNIQKITMADREAIKTRLEKSGTDISIEILSNTTARIKIKTNATQEHIASLLTQSGNLVFYEGVSYETIDPAIAILRNRAINTDTLLLEKFEQAFSIDKYGAHNVIGNARIKDTAIVNSIFKGDIIQNHFKENNLHITFKWGIANPPVNTLSLYAMKTDSKGRPAMYGSFIKDAKQQFTQSGSPSIVIEMNTIGTKKWAELTGRAAQAGFPIAIVLDDQVYSAPLVMDVITGGSTEMTGGFTVEFAQSLAQILSSASIPQLRIKNFETITKKE